VEVESLRIRSAATADMSAVAALDLGEGGSSWSEQSFANELKLPWSHVEVVECASGDGQTRIVGALVYWVVTDEIQLLNILTAPDLRRQGIGRFMMEHLFAQAKAADAVRITLEVRRSNHAAIALYQRFGFREVGARPGYYRLSGEDAILMECAVPTEPGPRAGAHPA
jgi:ribosomal-protein-alanine N-acetyltransferase